MKPEMNEESVAALKGMELVIIMPNRCMRNEDLENWQRQCCRAYVAQADIKKGITIIGESSILGNKDKELVCLNINETFQNPYLIEMKTIFEYVHAGVYDRREHPRRNDNGMAECAFL